VASQEILVPDIGNFKDVAVIEVLVKPGDRVEVDAPLLTLETEKATMDVPSPVAGVIEALHVAVGSLVSMGSLVAHVVADAAAAPARPAPASAAASVAAPVAKPAAVPAAAAAVRAGGPQTLPPINEAGFAVAHASPSVRLFARELGVDLARVRGGGQKGRITNDDVKAFVKAVMGGALTAAAPPPPALPKVPVVDYAAFGAVEIKPLSRIQKISGPRLHASWVNLPHITQYDLADITELEETRKSLKARAEAEGVKLTPLAFILRACVKALLQFPRFNASLDAAGENLVLKKYCHLGFAADTPNGLMVPVIRDADKQDVFALARSLGELSEKARKGKLGGAEMQGGCFTVSSLGGIGGTAFTPIINAPEVAILGVSKSSMQPVYRDGAFVPRLMLPLSLSYDHRVIDGAEGARFVTALSQALANVQDLLEPVK
jgi:pyruvate dehydrogenase E2 component (dihydrolipoamide acetyltransferase)